ncbi:hypothetical protein WJ0W_000146 [Paenibacillus melissococcoides]|uniref:Helicase C-terminal domain-containing protein n=1 Tax=Paenibacillus melissococcoides TaxID=2912268 RepID=A0ABM9FUX0_9BACL|nr:helicase-related protein [Paenibacillus melissococcoides]CAH8242937.1 hypothetical protein WJ0W_000146 [Paenibacillus melissococcoides]CAH8703430.1 hypothetical protein WDD9_000143 [Paenibacillus melissococcoides]CAH8706306.1 hypothetical protein HTL2_001227 [Paenibacillus melissococcoides]
MRDTIIDFLRKELIGPDPVAQHIQANGEEILIGEPPRLRYGAGILFPMESTHDQRDANDLKEEQILNDLTVTLDSSDQRDIEIEGEQTNVSGLDESQDSTDDTINLANSRMPSAMGYSCFLRFPENGLLIDVSAGRYKQGDYTVQDNEGNSYVKKAYYRESLNMSVHITHQELSNGQVEIPLLKEGIPTGLNLYIKNRTSKHNWIEDVELFTFTLINRLPSNGRIENESCFFQCEFSVRSKDGTACFLPYPERSSVSYADDEKSMRLLYRNHKTYAVGHGCAPSWKELEDTTLKRAYFIKAETMPVYELKPIVPLSISDVDLSMYSMSDYTQSGSVTEALSTLCDRYSQWINEQKEIAERELNNELKEIAEGHIEVCKRCLDRMRNGIKLIEQNTNVKKAFMLMNRAMLMQQLRYGLRLREWKDGGNGTAFLETITYPDLHNRETWPDWPEPKYGNWRPFQIAFILMNLKSIFTPEDDERNIVDIIWFPTGGGKTEAYLGLTAFTIFLKRLKNKDDNGTTVLMRYTLRLLTAQQYQRAASLICACEMIRKENETELGDSRITIGLWVGESLTPNKRAEAIKAFNQLNNSNRKEEENPFVILKCPWCGAQMGPIKTGKITVIRGYKKKPSPSTVKFQCHNHECDFSKNNFELPLQIIDEDIYDAPPTLLIGTVDKFAMLPWKPEARTLFGYRDKVSGGRVSPPELIIQDELHLISGPLGSMVGLYETFISELFRNPETGIRAKIIASTATISRAREQAHALYNCGKDNVFQFPPQCIDAGESFFACEDKESAGRIYVGVHATALPSHATTQIRVISSLLQGVRSAPVSDEKERNPYWSIVNYFNSLRELGHAATLIRADIREYLNAVWDRKGIRKNGEQDPRRFINRAIELTSRIPNNEIPQSLQALEINYPTAERHPYPVDICLATNMISVGLDVPRLGLMTVIGQPKTTSEYIQATSRVGRSKNAPGLVFVIYNTTKPRDRSHFEHFYSFHSTIYSQVEPTSVTPFSAPVRERALHALLIGFVRYFGDSRNIKYPQPFPDDDLLDRIRNIIVERVSNIDVDELIHTEKLLNERIDEWSRYLPPKYGDFAPPTSELPLMYPAGTTPLEDWDEKSWPTPTSMRNVDSNCEVQVIKEYLHNGGN